jgi:hypothetical protein
MARYQLKDMVLFVDADDFNDKVHPKQKGPRKPDVIPFPHILDKRDEPPAKCLKLSDEAGLIARFIVQGVDTDLIPQIINSEYGGKVPHPVNDVQTVLTMLRDEYDFLENRVDQMGYAPPRKIGFEPDCPGKYDLDFRVNWFGTGVIKF